MRKLLGISAGILGGTVLFSSSSKAAIVYSYVTDSEINSSSNAYTVAAGANVTVLVYLKEALSGGSTSLISQNNGLLGGGFSATQVGTAPSSPSTLTSVLGSTTKYNQSFSGGGFSVKQGGTTTSRAGADTANLSGSTGPIPNVADPADGQTDLIELGAFTLAAGTSPGTTSFILANYTYPTVSGSWTGTESGGAHGYNLDVTNTNPAYTGASTTAGLETFTITVTPEPATLGLLAIGSLGLLARRRKLPTT